MTWLRYLLSKLVGLLLCDVHNIISTFLLVFSVPCTLIVFKNLWPISLHPWKEGPMKSLSVCLSVWFSVRDKNEVFQFFQNRCLFYIKEDINTYHTVKTPSPLTHWFPLRIDYIIIFPQTDRQTYKHTHTHTHTYKDTHKYICTLIVWGQWA